MTTNDEDPVGPGAAVRFYNVRLSERDAWFAATIAVLFNGLGMLIEFAIIRKTPGVPERPLVISVIVAVILLVLLFLGRKRPSVKWAAIIYLVNSAAVTFVLVSTNLQSAIAEKHWVPFQASKLGCLIAALLAPEFWVGLVSILGYSLSAVLQFEYFFPPEIQTRVDTAEPWPVIAFALGGVLALIYRFRRVKLEQELAQIQAQVFAIRRLANAFLNIRDLMNSPLQVIELSVDALRKSDESQKPILDRIDRSVQNLREINSVLVEHEKEIEWQAKQ
jgi:hypothetical protein